MMAVDEAHLLNISVARTHQGLGFGARLLPRHGCCPYLRRGQHVAWKYALLTLALDLYRRFGFVRIGVRKGLLPGPEGREDAGAGANPGRGRRDEAVARKRLFEEMGWARYGGCAATAAGGRDGIGSRHQRRAGRGTVGRQPRRSRAADASVPATTVRHLCR